MRILVIGSGPVVVGQAAEFDYSGTQAIAALKDEGHEVVLINNNPATVMTDRNLVDALYMDPLKVEYLEKIIHIEKPDALLASVGGQTGLNLAIELCEKGILEKNNVQLLGSSLEAIKEAEDRSLFDKALKTIGEPSISGQTINALEEAQKFIETTPFPVAIRPAYTLGGLGGGIAYNFEDLKTIVTRGLKLSPISQCLIETCLLGLTEIEFEVIRDSKDNAIVVCHMENIDPVGVHTGDSVVVAPIQTLDNPFLQKLRSSALKIVRHLKIVGACNVQYAVDVKNREYHVIEVNPRVSRSSALASKATGYPIARVSSIVSLGLALDQVINPITQKTAFFEPSLDYVVVKHPRWPFDKMPEANAYLGTQMKSTGEVMAIGLSFEEALNKSIRSLEEDHQSLSLPQAQNMDEGELKLEVQNRHYRSLFYIYELLRRGVSVDELHQLSKISTYFLYKIRNIVNLVSHLKQHDHLEKEWVLQAKRFALTDDFIASQTSFSKSEIYKYRKSNGILPTFKMVDTCAAEFESFTPYYYSSYATECEYQKHSDKKSYAVLGVGPVRIGQGIEFDYCCVKASQALQSLGHRSVMINNNPGTVSTDFDHSDDLFFEPLDEEGVLSVLHRIQPEGVFVQFGGQTSLNLAQAVENAGYKIPGASAKKLFQAEDRNYFDNFLDELNILRPLAMSAQNINDVQVLSPKLKFPLMLRPSFVTGGQSMELVWDKKQLMQKSKIIFENHPNNTLLMDRFITGTEIEVDLIFDGEHVLYPGELEHIEKSGVHSGDSMAIFPSQHLSKNLKENIQNASVHICKKLDVVGPVNIQYILKKGKIYVIEVNPRSSRTVPFISKVSGQPLVKYAIASMLGQKKAWDKEPVQTNKYLAIKAPIFSYHKIADSETVLGPQMKSTGESIGLDLSIDKAFEKVIESYDAKIPTGGSFILTVNDKDKDRACPIVLPLIELGFKCFATGGTFEALKQLLPNSKSIELISKIGRSKDDLLSLVENGRADFIINTPSKDETSLSDGFKMRRNAIENSILCFTSLDTAQYFINAIVSKSTKVVNLNESY